MEQYFQSLRAHIRKLHGVESSRVGSSRVTLDLGPDHGKGWHGFVEVFALVGHQSPRCFAWAWDHLGNWEMCVILERDGVDNPTAAVQFALDHEKALAEGRNPSLPKSQLPVVAM